MTIFLPNSEPAFPTTVTMKQPQRRVNIVGAVRASILAKRERLLQRPVIARIGAAASSERAGDIDGDDGGDDAPAFWRILADAPTPKPKSWVVQDDGTCSVRVAIDYDERWHGREREVLEAFKGGVEQTVAFLTDQQRALLEKSPRAFLELNPRPEAVELVSFRIERVGRAEQVVEVTIATTPSARAHLHHVALVPNLVQLDRQLAALKVIEEADDDGPLAPLRALLGLRDLTCLQSSGLVEEIALESDEQIFDASQIACVCKALSTPHFALIHGPPGSGKTTVISSIVRRAIARGDRVLVVSPTHVAVDNVVEKVTEMEGKTDRLDEVTLPVRYAARAAKVSPAASPYWVGSKRQRRAATVSNRLKDRLIASVDFAAALYAQEDIEAREKPPLSAALAAIETLVCGTPIGVLSYEPVKESPPAGFGVVIVDEVSKMTLPEFLAIAVKAKRWVLVGDPKQLPPHNDAEDNAVTLDDLVSPIDELAASVVVGLLRMRDGDRQDQRLVVVAQEPARTADVIRERLISVLPPREHPPMATWESRPSAGIVVCDASQAQEACEQLARLRPGRDDSTGGAVPVLVERGLTVTELPNGFFVEPRRRSQAVFFQDAFHLFHTLPWSERSRLPLPLADSKARLAASFPGPTMQAAASAERATTVELIAQRFAVNVMSVFDWITGSPSFTVEPLSLVTALAPPLTGVSPFVGILKKQHRMHSSISRVPRALFYFNEALEDAQPKPGHYVQLIQVAGSDHEASAEEVDEIYRRLQKMNPKGVLAELPRIMVITPYRDQEALLRDALLEGRAGKPPLDRLDIEVCTLDRCQGREAACVFISLVKSKSTPFMDVPSRWNVALTRAKDGLFMVGDIEAHRRAIRRDAPSVLARIIDAYDQKR